MITSQNNNIALFEYNYCYLKKEIKRRGEIARNTQRWGRKDSLLRKKLKFVSNVDLSVPRIFDSTNIRFYYFFFCIFNYGNLPGTAFDSAKTEKRLGRPRGTCRSSPPTETRPESHRTPQPQSSAN